MNMGWIPPNKGETVAQSTARSGKMSLNEYVDAMNAWAREEVQDYVDNMAAYCRTPEAYAAPWLEAGGYEHPQPGSRLVMYGIGVFKDRSPNPSALYASLLTSDAACNISVAQDVPKMPLPAKTSIWNLVSNIFPLSGKGKAEPPPITESLFSDVDNEPKKSVCDFLAAAGVTKMVVGHTPRGDATLVMENHSLQVINADTSYAAQTQWDQDYTQHLKERPSALSKGDTRGATVNEVLFGTGLNRYTRIYGQLSNGLSYEFSLEGVGTNRYIGRKTADNWFVKAANVAVPNEDGSDTMHYLLSQVVGFTTTNKLVPEGDIHLLFPA